MERINEVLAAAIGQSAAQAALAAISAAGFVCVPREPTQRMIDDGWASANEEDAAATWRAMVQSFTTEAGSQVQ